MPVFHTRGLGTLCGGPVQNRLIQFHLSQHLLQHFLRHIAGTQDDGFRPRHIHNRGFQADSHGSAVQYHIYSAVHIFRHIFRHRGAGPPRRIGAGCCHKASGRFNKPPCHRMGWETDRHRIQSSCGFFGNRILFLQNHSQGPRPEGFGQTLGLLRHGLRNPVNILPSADMHNKRIIRRPSFGRIYFS